MKRTPLMIVVLSLLSTTCFAEEQIRPYLSIETGNSWTHLKSGGFNTAGDFSNTNDDTDSSPFVGVRAGLKYKKLKGDIGFNYRDAFHFKTDSFAPPTPVFFYKSKLNVSDAMFSVYYDFFSYKALTFVAGAGVGAALVNLKTDDTVVSGKVNDTNLAWKAEVGIEYPLSTHLTAYSNYRYIDFGKSKINLYANAITLAAGTFEADLTGNELVFGIRYTFK